MKPTLFDAALGRARAVEPSRAPRLGLAGTIEPGPGAASARRRRSLAVLRAALADWGFIVETADSRPDVCFGDRAAAGALWVKPGRGPDVSLQELAARSFSEEDFGYWALARRYSEDASLDWAELEDCRGQRERLVQAARSLTKTSGSAAPNPAGLAGYRQRLRRALMRDLDTAEALSTVWDALRPGALSPGSQLAALRLADEALALGLPLR